MSLFNLQNSVTNTVKFCRKIASDSFSKYNQLKLKIDNTNTNRIYTNIQLDDTQKTTELRKKK